MVDDDFQLPVVAARYLADPRVPADRKRRFLAAEGRLARVVSNLAFVARRAQPYARRPVATNLVSFPRAPDGRWVAASWRDSRAGYGGGRFAMDVNVIWVPHALEGVGTILDALQRLGLSPTIREAPSATSGWRSPGVTWRNGSRRGSRGFPLPSGGSGRACCGAPVLGATRCGFSPSRSMPPGDRFPSSTPIPP